MIVLPLKVIDHYKDQILCKDGHIMFNDVRVKILLAMDLLFEREIYSIIIILLSQGKQSHYRSEVICGPAANLDPIHY